jgi:hypothetical protein
MHHSFEKMEYLPFLAFLAFFAFFAFLAFFAFFAFFAPIPNMLASMSGPSYHHEHTLGGGCSGGGASSSSGVGRASNKIDRLPSDHDTGNAIGLCASFRDRASENDRGKADSEDGRELHVVGLLDSKNVWIGKNGRIKHSLNGLEGMNLL